MGFFRLGRLGKPKGKAHLFAKKATYAVEILVSDDADGAIP